MTGRQVRQTLHQAGAVQLKYYSGSLDERVWVFTWRDHAVGVGRDRQSVAAAGVVHEDGQRRVEGGGGEGVGAEGLARHRPSA